MEMKWNEFKKKGTKFSTLTIMPLEEESNDIKNVSNTDQGNEL